MHKFIEITLLVLQLLVGTAPLIEINGPVIEIHNHFSPPPSGLFYA